jgi:hypothetical protein
MKGARGWALLAGLGFVIVGVWQVLILSVSPPPGADPILWLIANQGGLGKSWGARIVVLLIALAPLRLFGEKAKGGWGTAARAFLYVWLPLSLLGALLQTQSVERLRTLHADAERVSAAETEPLMPPTAGETSPPAVAPSARPQGPSAVEVSAAMWRAAVEPIQRVALVAGLFGFAFLAASTGRRASAFSMVALLLLFALSALRWSPVVEAIVTVIEGIVLGAVAVAFPREAEPGAGARPR